MPTFWRNSQKRVGEFSLTTGSFRNFLSNHSCYWVVSRLHIKFGRKSKRDQGMRLEKISQRRGLTSSARQPMTCHVGLAHLLVEQRSLPPFKLRGSSVLGGHCRQWSFEVQPGWEKHPFVTNSS